MPCVRFGGAQDTQSGVVCHQSQAQQRASAEGRARVKAQHTKGPAQKAAKELGNGSELRASDFRIVDVVCNGYAKSGAEFYDI